MNLPEFLKAIAGDLCARASDGAADIGYEASIETLIASYRKFCNAFAQRYLDRAGTDHEIIHAFREKFMKMLKLSAITIDEVDTYLVGKYVDRRKHVIEIYLDAPRIRKELRRAAELPKSTKKKGRK